MSRAPSGRAGFRPWRVVHLDLRAGFPELAADPSIGGMFVVFWHGDVPLGQREFPAGQLPVPAAHLREIALAVVAPAVGRHLFEHGFRARLPLPPSHPDPARDAPADFPALVALDRPLDAMHRRLEERRAAAPDLTASVVVCTRDRPDQLGRCLTALHDLALRPEEIVVVDNAPETGATRAVIERWPAVRYVPEPRPGLSVARNTGIRAARGDIIAFTDDDVAVHPAWLGRILEPFEDPEVMAVTGLVLPAELDTEAQFLFQRGDSPFGWGYRELTYDREYFRDTYRRGTPVWHIGAGANMALRRSLFERVGGYDERLGAGASGCSEDSEMWYRVLAEGWKCVYTPLPVVHHRHRMDMAGLTHQMHQYLRGHVAAVLFQFDRYRHRGNLWRALVLLPRYYAGLTGRWLVRGLVGRGHRSDPGTRTLWPQVTGYLAGLWFYARRRGDQPTAAGPPIPRIPRIPPAEGRANGAHA